MAMRVARWLSRQLATFIRPLSRSPGLGALALPPELIFMIVAYLDTPSTVSLSLTCRSLYILCYPQELHLDTKEKEDLLLLLERDIATLYFCHYCTKLHRWYARWGNSCYWRDYDKLLPCQRRVGDRAVLHQYTCRIPYHQAHLVMNRHFYGPAHGLSIHRMKNQFHFHTGTPEYKVTYSESLQARIIDDRLVLFTTTTISQLRGETRFLRDYVDRRVCNICPHLIMAHFSNGYAPVQLPELNVGRDIPGYFTPCHTCLRSCPVCPTDYDIGISWDHGKRGFVIRIAAYHELGQCRSPFDWSWRVMTTARAIGTPHRKARSEDYGLGVVRDRWTKVDGRNSGDSGTWVEIPRL